MKYLTKGKRGKIYIDKGIAKKVSSNKTIKKEVYWLKLLNKHKIGPELINFKKNYFKYKFAEGDFILEYIEKFDKNKIKKALIGILKQCRILDKLKINKLEMHHPVKHIIIGRKAVMIDFERCYLTDKPKNTSQFCQFIMNTSRELNRKNIKINKKKLINKIKIYKNNQNEKNFKEIINLIA